MGRIQQFHIPKVEFVDSGSDYGDQNDDKWSDLGDFEEISNVHENESREISETTLKKIANIRTAKVFENYQQAESDARAAKAKAVVRKISLSKLLSFEKAA